MSCQWQPVIIISRALLVVTAQDVAEHRSEILAGLKHDAEVKLQAVRLAEDLCMEKGQDWRIHGSRCGAR